MLNVVCVLGQGGKVGYDSSWVEKLQRGIERNLTHPHRFICFSDCPVSTTRIPLDSKDIGFWAKLQMFKPGALDGPVMYLDLDTVICQNIDSVVSQIKNETFVMWHEADKNIHSSAFMYWQGDHSYIWDIFSKQPLSYWQHLYGSPPLYGDQAVISENVKHTLLTDHCPSEWFHIASHKDLNRNLESVKLLMFRKVSQKPNTMQYHPLVQQHWI